jgi:Putative DNA-binding domain
MRQAVRRRIYGLSVAGGAILCALVCLGSFLQRAISLSTELAERNQQTVARIPCRESGSAWTDAAEGVHPPSCDISAIENDPAFQAAEYVVDRRNRYFIYNKGHLPGFWMDRSDVQFVRQFREPKSVAFETGEQWRLYSTSASMKGKEVEVMVAVFEHAPWTIGENSVGAEVDDELRREADVLVKQLGQERVHSRADAWQIVEADTGRVWKWSGDVPALYPDQVTPRSWMVHFENGQVWLARSATTETLQAVSVAPLGSPSAFVLLGLVVFGLGSVAVYPLVKRFVRTGIAQPILLEEALHSGESEVVEFKQEFKGGQSFLKTVTAFANTRGGTIFIGIVDGTHEILGVDGATLEKRDAFERGLRDSIRNSIQPSPDVAIDYSRSNDRVIARVFVPAGRELHSYEGRYYVREGTQSRFVTDGEINRL